MHYQSKLEISDIEMNSKQTSKSHSMKVERNHIGKEFPESIKINETIKHIDLYFSQL